MPLLQRPSDTPEIVTLPQRKVQVAAETDVLIVGGGPAGLGAALGAAGNGVKVILVEQYGFLGGNATAALVMPLMSFYTQGPLSSPPSPEASTQPSAPVTLLPTDHGEGQSIVGGALDTLLSRLVSEGGAIAPSLQTGYVVPFDPEIFKIVALELLDEKGVFYLFHSVATEVIRKQGVIQGVVFETKSGPLVIRAKVTIDATGDGDVAARAGAPFEIGRASDGLVQPMTLMFRMGEFGRAAFDSYVKKHPGEWHGVHGLWDLIHKATEAGELELPREDILFFGTPHEGEVSVNSTRVTKVLGVDVWDLSYAERESRRQMRQIAAFLRKYVPGFEKSYLLQSGMTVGVRETRRITGEYVLTGDDILNARKFPDVIARASYPIDIHNPEGTGTILTRVPLGESYDVPLRCLLPQRVENLLTAGRCISGTHEAHSSYRVMPTAMATGQAAGVCAALAVRQEKSPRDVPTIEVQRELVRQGANLRDILAKSD